jgi:hypothetical protein
MNWLHVLRESISSRRSAPQPQREALLLWANELAAICDAHAPRAPVLQLDDGATDGEPELQLSWFWIDEQRALTVSVSEQLVPRLLLIDGTRVSLTEHPTHEQVKRAVQCFFEGQP